VLIAVKSRDLSHAYAFLQIAETLRTGGRYDEALEWAERGMEAFPERTDSRLREFLANEYHRRKRHDDAMTLIWAAFREIQGNTSPRRVPDTQEACGPLPTVAFLAGPSAGVSSIGERAPSS
jgi:tetratricopeptide (TPR) repeat protein